MLQVAILAGGLATRLRPLTKKIPKILLDVAGRPFAEWQVELLRRNGVERIVYCLGFLGEQVQTALGDGSRWGMTFDYISDGPRLLGTGGAIKRAAPLLDDSFIVMYGDSYLPCDMPPIEERFHASGKSGLMTVFRNEGLWDTSNVAFTDGKILRYHKEQLTPDMAYIDYGLGVLRRDVLDRYPADAPLDLARVYQDLLQEDNLAGYEVNQRFYEIGSREGLEELSEYLKRGMDRINRMNRIGGPSAASNG